MGRREFATEMSMGLELDRIRHNTPPLVQEEIDRRTEHSLSLYAEADPELVAARLNELDREWDYDRVFETKTSVVALAGCILGMFDKRFLLITGAAAGIALVQALSGRDPFVGPIRKMGVRTAREIERERYALKAMRGDFSPKALPTEATAEATANGENS